MTDAIVTLYIDYRSPYSYLANDEAYLLERDFDVRIDWNPYRIDVESVYGGVVQSRRPARGDPIRYCADEPWQRWVWSSLRLQCQNLNGTPMEIAFIGLGHMGAPMARNLRKAGHGLVVFDIDKDAMLKLAAAGAVAAASPKEAASRAETVITMLPSSPHVRTVYTGKDGVLSGVRPGVPLVDSSTIDPHTAREIAGAAEGQSNPMADAPVSGGVGGAEAATLTFMVGASTQLFERIKPVLSHMGKNIVHCGNPGNGQVAKICNNLLLAISMIGVAEAMTLGAALGIDPKLLAGIVNTSSGRCWSSDTYNPYPGVMENVPAARGYTGGFAADLMLKDLGLAIDAAKQAGQDLVLGEAARQRYGTMSAQGEGGKDFSAIINLYGRTQG